MSKLGQRIEEYGIPSIPYLPQGKNVLVFRIPSETRTAGGLYVPDEHREAKPMGVLLAAGLGARDVMADHLIDVGDVVWFGRFAGWEKEVQRDPEGKGKQILQLKIDDVLGSVDALERAEEYEICVVQDGENAGQHYYQKKGSK
jgi:chaperonin GroES